MRSRQLFLLDDIGKIRAAGLDINKCIYVDAGRSGQINPGHDRLKLTDCNALNQQNMIFTHNRGEDELLVVSNPTSYCIWNTGVNPNKSDSLRAFNCEALDKFEDGVLFTYREFDCTIGGDVDCCNTIDCGDSDCCQDYSCVAASASNGCTKETPARPTTTPPPPTPAPSPTITCEPGEIGCCRRDSDCPLTNRCVSRMCLTEPVLIGNTIDGTDWCITRRQAEVNGWSIAESAECRFTESPPSQLWSYDAYYRIHSEADPRDCLLVAPGDEGLIVYVAPCKANQFIYTDPGYELAQDRQFCLRQDENQVFVGVC